MIISISGKAGSGKSTLAEKLAKKLGFKRYYMGALRREMAAKRGMTLQEYNKLGETDPKTDIQIDEYLTKLGKEKDNFVIESRTAFHFIPNSIKVFLDVSEDEGARRVFKDLKSERGESRNEDKPIKTIAEMKESLRKRRKSDDKRYKKYYRLDIYDMKNYDFVIDTTKIKPEQVAKKIIELVKKK
jgi:cytidylate kinase